MKTKTITGLSALVAIICCICSSFSTFAHEGDTLKCHFDPSAISIDTLYQAGNGGFVCGNNGFGDREIAQKYATKPVGDSVGTECSVADGHQLNEVVVRFGAKYVTNASDSVYINVYSVNPATGGPDTLLGSSFPVQLSFVDTSATNEIYTEFLMQLPVLLTDSFFLSVVLPQTAGDTVGIISNSDGQGLGEKLCWVKNSSNIWSSLVDASSLDIDAAIFPVVGEAPIGIEELSQFVAHVNIFPNPARENTAIEYSVVKPIQHLQFTLYDLSGKVVYSLPLNNISLGEHLFNLNISELASGSYFYSFESNKEQYNGKLGIVK